MPEDDKPRNPLIAYVHAVSEWVNSEQYQRFIEGVINGLATFELYRRADELRWLPHHSMPDAVMQNILRAKPDKNQLEKKFEEFFIGNWKDVRFAFLQSLSVIDVDQEAKATFREAIEAHGYGLYKCVPRLLFPELERIINLLPKPSRKRPNTISIIDHALKDYGLSDFSSTPGFTLLAFGKLSDHLYHDMFLDKPYPKAHTDPVPNRHASIHGLVEYNRPYHSFNMLVMTEMTMAVVARILKDKRN